jgi:hypothetical protein
MFLYKQNRVIIWTANAIHLQRKSVLVLKKGQGL